jgi:CRISPR system Cascade subunit CasB
VEEKVKSYDHELCANFVAKKLYWLSNSNDEASVRAILAKLRRGLGKAPGDLPELWEFTLEGLPEELLSKGHEPTKGEWAVHIALSLFAFHQQGKDIKSSSMHKVDKGERHSIGAASRRLSSRSDKDSDAIRRRFNILATSNSLEELSHHLRAMIGLLKANDIALDYVQLASDLYRFQNPNMRSALRLRWGQDFYAFGAAEEEKTET